jgi:hypothetical protein
MPEFGGHAICTKSHASHEANGIFQVFAMSSQWLRIAHLDLIGFMQTNHFGENATLLLPESPKLGKQSTHQLLIQLVLLGILCFQCVAFPLLPHHKSMIRNPNLQAVECF